jgi:NAD(P)-dependent dehydrogenase (short-subunit alcohol dehydrogenase family)
VENLTLNLDFCSSVKNRKCANSFDFNGNCAVLISTGKPLTDLSTEQIQKEIGTNILGNFYTIKEFLPGMQKLGRGHIVTVSSALGFCGPANLSKLALPLIQFPPPSPRFLRLSPVFFYIIGV